MSFYRHYKLPGMWSVMGIARQVVDVYT